jgi:hypothetical protein
VLTFALRILAAGAFLAAAAPESTNRAVLKIAGLGDCERVTKDGPVPESPRFWNPRTRTLTLHGARNEVVAAQLILTTGGGDVKDVDVEVGDLRGAGRIDVRRHLTLYREVYQYVENGDWSWGPPSRVLPSRRWYPDVLVPFVDPWRAGRRVGAPFDVTTAMGPNQGVFLDLWIPPEAPPGLYAAPIRVLAGRAVLATATLQLTVHEIRLPDETHVDAFGELYGHAYQSHGTPYAKDAGAWRRIAARYHQCAHAHRMVVQEREGAGPAFGTPDWDDFYGPVLDGSLFSEARGYRGPGLGTGVPVFRAPIRQAYDGHAPDFDDSELEAYSLLAAAFRKHAAAKGWTKTRFFAYVIDEAPTDARTRENERRLQAALDAGTAPGGLPLLWVSHESPATLASDPSRDRRGLTRWWVPHGGACDPAFLQPRIAAGETVWFYHHGHPAVGVHGVNATGVELRTWGAICWRYGLHGSFVWAVDFGDPERPLEWPNYKRGETRWGNGVLFYPGARLPDIGLPPIDGPLPSLRLKAYRRGLQDYEYAWLLAQAGKRSVADAIVRRVIPVALTEAKTPGVPPWSTDVNDWYRMREELAAALTTAPAPRGR